MNTLSITNCVFYQTGGYSIGGYHGSLTIRADYNAFYKTGGWIAPDCFTVRDWQQTYGVDAHGLYVDPLFADAESYDFHLKSEHGRYLPGYGWTNDTASSSLLDIGDPAHAWSNEPDPNGSQINMGAFGNTEWASKSATNAWLLALTCNEGGRLAGTATVYWAYGAFTNESTSVRIDYSSNDGATWTNVTTGVALTNGQFAWDTTGYAASGEARWRVMWEVDNSVYDVNDAVCTLRHGFFYVNDANTAGDVYCTVAGNDTNSGTAPGKPKLTLTNLLADLDLGPTDIVYIDTGVYQGYTVTVGSEDGGDESDYVTFQGSTNAAAGGTEFDRNNTSAGVYVFDLDSVSYVRLCDMTLRRGYAAVYLGYDHATATGSLFERLIMRENVWAVYDSTWDVRTFRFSNCVYAQNTEYGHCFGRQGHHALNNCVFYNNTSAGIYVSFRWGGVNTLNITNSIFYQSGGDAIGGHYNALTIGSDFNNLFTTNGADVGPSSTTLVDWQSDTGQDSNSISLNPLFAAPETGFGDFHLKSKWGRWTTSGWTADALTSPSIDAGHTNNAFDLEVFYNGKRVNQGIYGNTAQASKSEFSRGGTVFIFR